MDLGSSYREIIDNLHDGVYVLDRDRIITFWSRGAERLTGYKAEEVVGSSCRDNILVHVDETGRQLCLANCPASECMATETLQEAEVFLLHKDGHRVPVSVRVSPLKDEAGQVKGAIEIFADASHYMADRQRIRELERLAMVDSLTGLPNRRFLEAQLTSRQAEFERLGWPYGLILVDIDHFKKINDSYGHLVGDEALKVISLTLDHSSRPYDVVGRWGGEEFLGIMPNIDRKTLLQVAERYRGLIAQSEITFNEFQFRLTVSVGGAVVEPGLSLEQVIDRADNALYEAKEAGRNRTLISG